MLKKTSRLFLTLCFAAALTSQADAKTVQGWVSKHFKNHVLVGKIWSSNDQKFISEKQLQDQIASARFVLLGEIHTNRDHHRRRAGLLKFIKTSPAHPANVIVEMIPERLGAVYAKHVDGHGKILSTLGAALEWKKRGWGDFSAYAPIFEVTGKNRLQVLAGNLDRADIKALARGGIKTISKTKANALSLNIAYNGKQKQKLDDILFNSHCKFVPRKHLTPMRVIQQARDGFMANAMAKTPKNATAVLIAGNGHIRADFAVPRLLEKLEPGAKIVTVAFMEVSPDQKNAKTYEPQSANNKPVYDYLYFTPKSEIKDHCADLAKRFKKKKASK